MLVPKKSPSGTEQNVCLGMTVRGWVWEGGSKTVVRVFVPGVATESRSRMTCVLDDGGMVVT